MRADPASDRGFTLIEVLVVLVILGLALGVVAGRGPARHPALDAAAAAEQLARTLRLARSEAIAGNHEVAVTLDIARRGVRVGEGAWQGLPPSLDIAVTGVPATAGTAARIVFAPDGGSTGGQVRVAAGATVRVVTVNWLSGRVTVNRGA